VTSLRSEDRARKPLSLNESKKSEVILKVSIFLDRQTSLSRVTKKKVRHPELRLPKSLRPAQDRLQIEANLSTYYLRCIFAQSLQNASKKNCARSKVHRLLSRASKKRRPSSLSVCDFFEQQKKKAHGNHRSPDETV
jgi:hypothetical protein